MTVSETTGLWISSSRGDVVPISSMNQSYAFNCLKLIWNSCCTWNSVCSGQGRIDLDQIRNNKPYYRQKIQELASRVAQTGIASYHVYDIQIMQDRVTFHPAEEVLMSNFRDLGFYDAILALTAALSAPTSESSGATPEVSVQTPSSAALAMQQLAKLINTTVPTGATPIGREVSVTTDNNELLARALEKIKEFESFLEDFNTSALHYGTITNAGEDPKYGFWVDISGKRKYLKPETLKVLEFVPKLGDQILYDPQTGTPAQVIERGVGGSKRTYIQEVLPQGVLVTDSDVVYEVLCEEELAIGDAVLVSGEFPFVTTKLPKNQETRFLVSETGVCWDDIGGLTVAKELLINAVRTPVEHQDLFASYGKKTSAGVLLYGPPGNGKTMLAKAAATEIASLFGAEKGGYFYLKGPEVLSKWVGESEATVRSVFQRARDFHEENGYPAVIFIDEAEAILGRRGRGIMTQTIVPQFLSEMDGLDATNAFVLLATNRPDDLDSAVIRDGRIDKKIHVKRPTQEDAKTILRLYFDKYKTKNRADSLTKKAVEAVFDRDKTTFYMIETADGSVQNFGIPELLNGAMLRNIVETASELAMSRDIEGGQTRASGITIKDVEAAVTSLVEQNRGLEHTEVLREFARGMDVRSIEKAQEIA